MENQINSFSNISCVRKLINRLTIWPQKLYIMILIGLILISLIPTFLIYYRLMEGIRCIQEQVNTFRNIVLDYCTGVFSFVSYKKFHCLISMNTMFAFDIKVQS